MQENYSKNIRYILVFMGLGLMLAVMAIVSIYTGNVTISLSELLAVITGDAGNSVYGNIIWKIRLPRLLMTIILGGALALAGFLLQTFFANPIAGPYVLGISSGAKMMVALTMIVFLQSFKSVSSFTLIAAAFAGSMIATGFILLMSRVIHHMSTLLVGGIMIGYICSAVTDFIVTFAEDSDIVNLHGWSQGNFSGMSWENVRVACLIVAVVFILTFLLSKPMTAYMLGENYARSMGVNIRAFRAALILLSSLLSACVTAFAGPVSFVGIAVPYLVKGLLGTAKPMVVIPAVFLGGAVFCMACDLVARMAFAPMELNISTVTAIFGAPIVIWMLLKRKKGK